jgi:hypothetical protein
VNQLIRFAGEDTLHQIPEPKLMQGDGLPVHLDSSFLLERVPIARAEFSSIGRVEPDERPL